ncbi:hypothetical protein HDU97_000813 [Phlyctochytrium planicorne]|nr:hypothetical protein HDU97_000813 [Phlyctochytrium planicorne]
MRDGKLGAGARSLILRSCDLILSEAILPTRAFKNYVPRTFDNPTYSAVGLPTCYGPDGSPSPLPSSPASSSSTIHRTQPNDSGPRDSSTAPERLQNDSSNSNESPQLSRPATTSGSIFSSHPTPSARSSYFSAKPKDKEFMDDFRHMDTEWSMRTMDHLFNATFADFVRNDKNCECTGRHLARVVKEFKLDQVVMGVRWLIDGWPVESTAKLLKAVFDDWLPELAALAIAQIGSSWPLRPKMGLIVAYLMMAEKVNVVALFIKSLTIGWSPTSVTELISCLDTVLEWDDKFFNEFTETFINELIEGKDHGETNTQDPEIMVRALAAMYKTSIASTNYRILLADFRLSIAKSSYLNQYNHFISCPQCIRQESCSFAEHVFIPMPSGVVRATRNSTHDLPIINQAALRGFRLTLTNAAVASGQNPLRVHARSSRSLPLRLGSSSSTIGSIGTPSIFRSSSAGYVDEDEYLDSLMTEEDGVQWEMTPSSWPSTAAGNYSRPGTVDSNVINWRRQSVSTEIEEEDDIYSDDFAESEDMDSTAHHPHGMPLLPRRHMTPLPPIPRVTASAPANMIMGTSQVTSIHSSQMPNGNTRPPVCRQISRISAGLNSGSHSRSASNKPMMSDSRTGSSFSLDDLMDFEQTQA